MKRICAIIGILSLVLMPSAFAEKKVTIDKFKGLYSNPSPPKIPDGGHTKFQDVYISDGNIQSVKGRDRLNSTAHSDTTVNGFFYYEKPAVIGDSDNVDLLVSMDGDDASTTFTDDTGNHTLSAVGDAQVDTAQSKFGGASLLVDGNDYVSAPDSDDWFFDTNDFTISFWFKLYVNAPTQILMRQQGSWTITKTATPDADLAFNGTNVAMTWDADFTTGGGWYHIEIVRKGSNFYGFKNGVSMSVLAGSATDPDSIPDAAAVLEIGSTLDDGWIDEVRIDNGTASHTNNFAVPKRAYTLSASAVQKLVVAESDDVVVYDTDGTNRTVILADISDNAWDFMQVGTALYMTNQVDGQYKWFGNTSVSASRKDNALDHAYLVDYKGVVFSALDRNLHYSNEIGEDETDDETWDSGNHISVGQNQYIVTGLSKGRNSLVIFTPSSIQELTGFGTSFELRNLGIGIGCVSNETIELDTNGDVIFFAGIQGVYKLQIGGQLTDVSAGVEIDRTDTTIRHISAPALDDIFAGIDSDIDLDPNDYAVSHAYYDLERDLYFLYIDKHCFVYDNAEASWSYLPGTEMVASTYAYSTEFVEAQGYLIDNKGFFYENWTGNENGIESGTVTGNPTGSTNNTLTDTGATFNTTDDGLAGVWVAIKDETTEELEFNQIASNTGTVLTMVSNWASNPTTGDTYYVAYLHPDVETKQYTPAKAPNETEVLKTQLVHEKSDSSQTLIIDHYINKSTTTEGQVSIDLADDYIDPLGTSGTGTWHQWRFRTHIYDTSDTINPPVNIENFTIQANVKEAE